jgi:translation initiation factor 2B subunit (eIF-2B alpha/beta/delta family)
MPTDLEALAEKVRCDSVSGSSETAIYVLGSLRDIFLTTDVSGDQLRNFSIKLKTAKPAMAPLSNIARMMESAASDPVPNKAALLQIESVIKNEKSAGKRIAKNAMKKLEGTVLTLSYSGTVMNVLKEASKQKDLKVTVAESFPLGEGRRTAEQLSALGIETTLIPDSMVFIEARNSDLCLVGADAITPHMVINKVGTYAAVLASVQAGIPSYVVSSTLKMTSELKPDWMIENRKDGKLTERSQLFEPTPLELFDEVITELSAPKPGCQF